MASSISSTKPMTNGHLQPSDQQQEGILEALGQFIHILSGDNGFQTAKMLVNEYEILKQMNKTISDRQKQGEVTIREMCTMVEEMRNEKRNAEDLLGGKKEELEEYKKQGGKVEKELEERQKEVADLKQELHKSRGETSEAIKTSKNRSDEVMKLRDEVKEERKSREDCQKEAKRTQEELTEAKKQLELASRELASIKELAFTLRTAAGESTTIKGKLDAIFTDVYRLAGRFFGELKLVDGIFQSIPWDNLVKDGRLAGIPLPPTNSVAARHMRAAAVLRLIALATVRHLFQPVYLTEEGGELGEVLDDIHFLDPPRAHWVRSILLMINPEQQVANGRRRAEAVVRDVLQSVGALLVSSDNLQDKKNEFRVALYEWCQKAVGVWRDLQTLEGRFTVLFVDDTNNLHLGDWTRLPEKGTLLTQGGAPANEAGPKPEPKGGLVSDEIVAKLWPAFFVSRAKDGVSKRFRGSYVLVESQVAAARREVASARSGSNSSHRRGRETQRRLEAMTDGSNDSTADIESFLSSGR